MTIEEAKEVFLNRGIIDGIYNGDKWREACIVISKWLEQEPTTKNNLGVEYISRADVNQVIEDYMDEQYHVLSDRTRERAFGAKVVKARINELPTVTPQEPKTGHWIECMPGGAEEWCYKCSECNYWKYKKTINLSKFKFCPNCGAKMVEPQESEDKE